MNRRDFVKRMTAGSAALLGSSLSFPGRMLAGTGSGRQRPNIILILADDMGFSDIGCYGSEIRTPNIDRLAAGGIRFTGFYNAARCCPTRASLLTGLYPHQTGIGLMTGDDGLPGYRGDLNRQCVTIAEALKSGGYRTYMMGKWHVTPMSESKHNWPLQRGFDRFYGTIRGAGSYFDPSTLVRDNEQIAPEGDSYYYTDAVTDNAVNYIREASKGNAPFFLYAAYTAPHWPLHALPEDIEKYEHAYDKGWDALREERFRRMKELGIAGPGWELSERDSRVPAWEEAPDKAWESRRMAVYAAQLDRMDRGIGRILQTLKENNQFENTLILFLADNGGCAEGLSPAWSRLPAIPTRTRDGRPVAVGNNPEVMPGPETSYQSYGRPWANVSDTPFRFFKHWVHEGGISTPLIAHWPAGIPEQNAVHRETGHIIDILPTCLEAAGVAYPEQFDSRRITPPEGKSLLPLLQGKSWQGHTSLGWEHHGNQAFRKGRFKIVKRSGHPWELYDMEEDRTEVHDLAEKYPEKVEELAGEYQAWADRVGVVDYARLKDIRKKRKEKAETDQEEAE